MKLLSQQIQHFPKQMRNCLIGGAVGDALGFLVELKPIEEVQAFAARLSTVSLEKMPDFLTDMTAEDWKTQIKHQSGQVSDDTQLSLLLAESLYEVTPNGYHQLFLSKLRRAFAENKIYSYGDTTKAAALYRVLPEESNASTSNGSVMRIAPLGIFLKDHLAMLATEAARHSSTTHPNPVCQIACVAQALAIALAVQKPALSNTTERLTFIGDILRYLPKGDGKKLYAKIKEIIVLDNVSDIERAMLALDAQQNARTQNGGISMHAITSVMWAHLCFLMSPDDYWQTVCTALHIGGDVDTVAATAGSLSAVYNGAQGIPNWADGWLHNTS